ncbi:MAG: 6-phosphogluconolactonase [Spirochaetales bacterium]|nr:6-phosphogluconolactonase [Spirochaetales bacterium]
MKQTRVYADAEQMAEEAAGLFARLIEEDLGRYPNPVVILSGGSTPTPCYQRLARLLEPLGAAVHSVHWVIGDERWVPVNDPSSNEGMIRRSLLEPLGVPEERILSWRAGEGTPLERARDYQRALRSLLGAPESPSESTAEEAEVQPAHAPDLTLLGLGADGHTVSLFPDGVAVPGLSGAARTGEVPVGPEIPGWTAAIYAPSLQGFRLTLTAGLLRASRRIFFLVSGSAKREGLRGMLDRDAGLPASWLNLPQTEVLATRDAVATERI